jgi:hypothetical protein
MRQILSRSLLTAAAASSILAMTGGHADADADARGAAIGSPGVLSGNTVQTPIDVPVNVCGNTVDIVAAGNAAFGNTCANVSRTGHSGDTGAARAARNPALSDAGGAGETEQTGEFPQASDSQGARDSHGPRESQGALEVVSDAPGASGNQIAAGSPGVLSGNAVDSPVRIPVNTCGNSVDGAALLNPTMGNSCANVERRTSVSAPVPRSAQSEGPDDTPLSGPSKTSPTRTQDVPVTTSVANEPADAPELAATGANGRQVGAAGAAGAALVLGGAMLYRRGRGGGRWTRGIHGAPAEVRIR